MTSLTSCSQRSEMQSLRAGEACRHRVTPTESSSPRGCLGQAACPAALSQWRHALPAAKGSGVLHLTRPRRHKPDCSSARWPGHVCAAAGSPDGGSLGFAGLMASLMQQAQQQVSPARPQAAGAGVLTYGATLDVASLHYHPAGAQLPLLQDVSLHLPANQLGLIYGRSGAGKTTLLQLIAGLAEPTTGAISVTAPAAGTAAGSGAAPTLGARGSKFAQLKAAEAARRQGGAGAHPPSGNGAAARRAAESGGPAGCDPVPQQPPTLQHLASLQRMADVGLVFQFPERHFLGATVGQELSFGWSVNYMERQQLSVRTHSVLAAVGLSHIPLETPLQVLSDGYKRRVALAVQLVRRPKILLLDEPLAGLDWQTRAEVATTLAELKRRCTVLVVSHDLRELVPLVDVAWQVRPGGKVQIAELPLL